MVRTKGYEKKSKAVLLERRDANENENICGNDSDRVELIGDELCYSKIRPRGI